MSSPHTGLEGEICYSCHDTGYVDKEQTKICPNPDCPYRRRIEQQAAARYY